LRFVTWTLKYNRCHWLEVLGLDRHYARAEISAKLGDDVLVIDEPRNINRFAIYCMQLPATPKKVRIGTSDFAFPQTFAPISSQVTFTRHGDQWQHGYEEALLNEKS